MNNLQAEISQLDQELDHILMRDSFEGIIEEMATGHSVDKLHIMGRLIRQRQGRARSQTRVAAGRDSTLAHLASLLWLAESIRKNMNASFIKGFEKPKKNLRKT